MRIKHRSLDINNKVNAVRISDEEEGKGDLIWIRSSDLVEQWIPTKSDYGNGGHWQTVNSERKQQVINFLKAEKII